MTPERIKRDIWRFLPEWLEANRSADDMLFYAWLGQHHPMKLEMLRDFNNGEDPWQTVHAWMNEYRNLIPDN